MATLYRDNFDLSHFVEIIAQKGGRLEKENSNYFYCRVYYYDGKLPEKEGETYDLNKISYVGNADIFKKLFSSDEKSHSRIGFDVFSQ